MSLISSIFGTRPNYDQNTTRTPEQLWEAQKEIAFILSGMVSNTVCGKNIIIAVGNTGICLQNIVPLFIQKAVRVNNAIYDSIFSSLPEMSRNFEGIILGPVMEEFQVGFLFQEVLLRRLPKKILSTYAPEYVHLVDATPTKISRIALRTMLFALLHLENTSWICGGNYGFGVLGLGVVAGYLTEKVNGIGPSILTHMFSNAIASFATS